jgi:hypothetical protein
MPNSTNLFVITTTLANKAISEKRRNNLLNEFSQYDVPIIFNHGILKKSESQVVEIMYTIILKALQTFKRVDCEYALICDDDFFPIPNFMEELNATMDKLPEDWRSLHLCPGYLWGRAKRNASKLGCLNPEGNIDAMEKDESGRLFVNVDAKYCYNKFMWLGGPIAFIVNKKHIDNFIEEYTKIYKEFNLHNDRIFTKMLTKNDYICRIPMLGTEREEGGTTF